MMEVHRETSRTRTICNSRAKTQLNPGTTYSWLPLPLPTVPCCGMSWNSRSFYTMIRISRVEIREAPRNTLPKFRLILYPTLRSRPRQSSFALTLRCLSRCIQRCVTYSWYRLGYARTCIHMFYLIRTVHYLVLLHGKQG